MIPTEAQVRQVELQLRVLALRYARLAVEDRLRSEGRKRWDWTVGELNTASAESGLCSVPSTSRWMAL